MRPLMRQEGCSDRVWSASFVVRVPDWFRASRKVVVLFVRDGVELNEVFDVVGGLWAMEGLKSGERPRGAKKVMTK